MQHPGDLLRVDLQSKGLSQRDLARILGVSDVFISDLVNGKRGISVETAKKLAEVGFRTAREWLELQSAYALARSFDREGIR